MRPSVDTSQSTHSSAAAELSTALASCHSAFFATGLISAMSNVLMLTGAIFMLQVYDRVLPSRSVPTLIGLAILAVGLYAALGLLDLIRGRILTRIGISLDEALSGQIYQTIVRLPVACRDYATTAPGRCEISTASARFWADLVRSRCSICRGYHSISGSASLSISGSA